MSRASSSGFEVAKDSGPEYFSKSRFETFSVTESLVLADSIVETKILNGSEWLVSLIVPRAVVLWTADWIRSRIRLALTFLVVSVLFRIF